ncbi:hypothetical protein FKY77_08135 [Enterococcus faecium]|nr:hypothetical protein FKY77_08135 [Enterococcus faecium]
MTRDVSQFLIRTKGVQSADPRYSLNKRQNMRNYFAVCFSNTQFKTLILQPLGKRCSKACIYGTKPNQMKNMECYFYLIVLTA